MPHNLYLHSGLVQSRAIRRDTTISVRQANKYFALDSTQALVMSFLVNLTIVAVFAHGFFSPKCAVQGQAQIRGKCQELSLEQGQFSKQDFKIHFNEVTVKMLNFNKLFNNIFFKFCENFRWW